MSFLILSFCVIFKTLQATELLCAFCTRLAPSQLPAMFSGSASLMDPTLLPWMRVFPPVHLPSHFQLPLLINHRLLMPQELPLTITILQTQNSPKFQVFYLGLKPQRPFLKRNLLCRSDWYTVRILFRSRPRNVPISFIYHFGKIHTFFKYHS